MSPLRMNPSEDDPPPQKAATKRVANKAAQPAKKTTTKRSASTPNATTAKSAAPTKKIPQPTAKKAVSPKKTTTTSAARAQKAPAKKTSAKRAPAKNAQPNRATPYDPNTFAGIPIPPRTAAVTPTSWLENPTPPTGTTAIASEPDPTPTKTQTRTQQPPRQRQSSASWTWSDRIAYGLASQPWAVAFALLAAWTGLIVALWAAFFGFFLGILIAVGAIAANSVSRDLFNAGAGQAVGAVGIVTGALVGAGGSFVAVYTDVLFSKPWYVIGSVASGFLLGLLIFAIVSALEGDYLRYVRGYRHLVREESRRVAPLLSVVGDRMNLSDTPKLAIANTPIPSAWTHTRHIVLSRGLLDTLTDDELMAVLAHELHHWNRGHAVGLTLVSACGWPIIALYNFAAFLGGYRLEEEGGVKVRTNFGSIIIWFIFWPAWVLARLIIGPAAAARTRLHEFEADAATKAIGLGPPLAKALTKLSAFEGGRTGWEAVTSAAHPPTAVRLDRLQPKRADDDDYVDAPLGGITPERVKVVGYVFAVAIVLVIAGGAVINHDRSKGRVLSGYSQTATGAEQAGLKFAAQFFDDGSNESAVRSLVANNSPPSYVNGLMTEWQTLAAGFNTAVANGLNPTVTAVATGCNVTLNSDSTAAQVDLNERWTVTTSSTKPLVVQLSTVMHLLWLGRWQVEGLAARALGTADYPTSFGACP